MARLILAIHMTEIHTLECLKNFPCLGAKNPRRLFVAVCTRTGTVVGSIYLDSEGTRLNVSDVPIRLGGSTRGSFSSLALLFLGHLSKRCHHFFGVFGQKDCSTLASVAWFADPKTAAI